ncbi:hypothetical protein M0804_009205 [Polistes exclamans]|nr:hypothetical protein M0804_009205 [Polistes exclamans]
MKRLRVVIVRIQSHLVWAFFLKKTPQLYRSRVDLFLLTPTQPIHQKPSYPCIYIYNTHTAFKTSKQQKQQQQQLRSAKFLLLYMMHP